MRKHILIKMAAAIVIAGASVPAMAQSGSSGTSGSAGLGIDYGALASVSGTGNPGIALPGKSATGTLGGPIAGLARHFSRNKRGN